jgi:DNA-binding response OmpR family regulator
VGEILLVAADWQLRALVRAQLLEEGYGVKALPSLDLALAHVLRTGELPRLTILDAQGIHIEAQDLARLQQLTGQAPLILCGGALSRAELSREDLPPARLMLRPFRVADLVAEVRRVLACPKDGATGR